MSTKKTAGYTIFELVVVVAIIFIFTGLSIVALNKFNDDKLLEGETKKFVEFLEVAKKKTIAGDKPCSAYTGNYTVNWSNSDGTYTMTPNGCGQSAYLITYTVPTNISILSTSSVQFLPFGLGVFSPNIVIFKNVAASKCRLVTIQASGNIFENKLTCP